MCLHLVEQRLMSVIRSCLLPTESVIVWSAQRDKWGVEVTSIQSPVLIVLLCNTDLSCCTLDQQNSNTLPWHLFCNYIHF